MNLFRRVRERSTRRSDSRRDSSADQAATANYVLAKNTGAVLRLTACIEWFTQLHYTEAFDDDAELDPLTKNIFPRALARGEPTCADGSPRDAARLRGDGCRTRAPTARSAISSSSSARSTGLLVKQTGYDVENTVARARARSSPRGDRGPRARHPAREALDLHRERRHPPTIPGALRRGHARPAQQARVGEALTGLPRAGGSLTRSGFTSLSGCARPRRPSLRCLVLGDPLGRLRRGALRWATLTRARLSRYLVKPLQYPPDPVLLGSGGRGSFTASRCQRSGGSAPGCRRTAASQLDPDQHRFVGQKKLIEVVPCGSGVAATSCAPVKNANPERADRIRIRDIECHI